MPPARPRSTFQLFPDQFRALYHEPAPELLVASRQHGIPAGASHLLRAFALRSCVTAECSILLLQRNETELYQRHLAGPNGLFAMIYEMQAHGFASIGQGEIRFKNGSTIQWSGCAREAEIAKLADKRIDVLLVDDVDDVPETIYWRLRESALGSHHGSRRVVAAARDVASAGWVGRHWSVNAPGRAVLYLDPAQIDAELVQRAPVSRYAEWIDRVHGGQWIWAPHTRRIVDAVDHWIHGKWQHLAVFVPSQHGKTESGPRNAVAYLLQQLHPSDWCSIASYQTEIANSRSADARENFLLAGGELMPGRKKVREWQTLAGGGCWSAGTAAGQTGRSATWSFIDDPDKDWADAVSGVAQKKKRRWYGSTYRARESMFAAEMRKQKLCATVTRWDPEDLIGYALKTGHDAGERWGVLVLSALYDPKIVDGYREMYPRFDILEDYRSTPGEPLWPERRSAEDWQVVFQIRGPMIADCECQQSPRGAERGGQFDADWFVRRERDPAFAGRTSNEAVYAETCRAWDLAATEGAGDWTAGVKVGLLQDDGKIVIRHSVRAQFAPVGVKQLIAATMLIDGPRVSIRLPIDPASGGQAQVDEIIRYLRQVAGWAGVPLPRIIAKRPRRGASATQSAKAVRAHDFRSVAEPPGKNIPGGVSYVAAGWSPSPANFIDDWEQRCDLHPELREVGVKAAACSGDWWTPWLQEFQGFTGDEGRVDDQVDATVDGYEEVYQPVGLVSGVYEGVPGW